MLVLTPFIFTLLTVSSITPVISAPVPTAEYAGQRTARSLHDDEEPATPRRETALAKRTINWKTLGISLVTALGGGLTYAALKHPFEDLFGLNKPAQENTTFPITPSAATAASVSDAPAQSYGSVSASSGYSKRSSDEEALVPAESLVKWQSLTEAEKEQIALVSAANMLAAYKGTVAPASLGLTKEQLDVIFQHVSPNEEGVDQIADSIVGLFNDESAKGQAVGITSASQLQKRDLFGILKNAVGMLFVGGGVAVGMGGLMHFLNGKNKTAAAPASASTTAYSAPVSQQQTQNYPSSDPNAALYNSAYASRRVRRMNWSMIESKLTTALEGSELRKGMTTSVVGTVAMLLGTVGTVALFKHFNRSDLVPTSVIKRDVPFMVDPDVKTADEERHNLVRRGPYDKIIMGVLGLGANLGGALGGIWLWGKTPWGAKQNKADEAAAAAASGTPAPTRRSYIFDDEDGEPELD